MPHLRKDAGEEDADDGDDHVRVEQNGFLLSEISGRHINQTMKNEKQVRKKGRFREDSFHSIARSACLWRIENESHVCIVAVIGCGADERTILRG